jgi:hypothetical protein
LNHKQQKIEAGRIEQQFLCDEQQLVPDWFCPFHRYLKLRYEDGFDGKVLECPTVPSLGHGIFSAQVVALILSLMS